MEQNVPEAAAVKPGAPQMVEEILKTLGQEVPMNFAWDTTNTKALHRFGSRLVQSPKRLHGSARRRWHAASDLCQLASDVFLLASRHGCFHMTSTLQISLLKCRIPRVDP